MSKLKTNCTDDLSANLPKVIMITLSIDIYQRYKLTSLTSIEPFFDTDVLQKI